jgi:hypothetical protein
MLIEWQPGIKVRDDLIEYMDELAEELFYGGWDKTDSIEARILPLTWETSASSNKYERPVKGNAAGLANYGVSVDTGNPLVVAWIPPKINSYYKLFVAAHEVAHIVNQGITPEKCFKTQLPNPILKSWYETKANEWAVEKFKKWNVKLTHQIKATINMDFLWMMDVAKENPELMEAIKDHPRVRQWLETTAKW